jgi:cytidylate kinase
VSRSLFIAIDGPAGAGKSSVSAALAKRLGYIQIDTGAIYRSITLFELRNPTAFNLASIDYRASQISDSTHHYLNGEDVTDAIRSAEVTAAVSRVSSRFEVRAFAVELQRTAARNYLASGFGVVLEGRDIGTVVLPDADLKFFLTASIEKRAERRSAELNEDLSAHVQMLNDRDAADMGREISPLVQAHDAILVDTTDLDFDEVLNVLMAHVTKRIAD